MFGEAFLRRLRPDCDAGKELYRQDPQLAQLVDSSFEDVLLYPDQHPDIVLSAAPVSHETRTGDIRARSGWSAPNMDQNALVMSFLSQSKAARFIKNIVAWLEQTYTPKIDPGQGVYNMVLEHLRAGKADEAVDLLDKNGCSLQATMLAGAIMSHAAVGVQTGSSPVKRIGITGNTSFIEWMKKAQTYSKDPRTPINERAVFGLLSGNASYYLSIRKTKSPESVLWAESKASLMNFILAACEGEDDEQLNKKANLQLDELLKHLPEEERLIASCNFYGLANHLSTRCVVLRDQAASPSDFIALSNLCLLALHVLASLLLVLGNIDSRRTMCTYTWSVTGNDCIARMRDIVGWYGNFAHHLCDNERMVNPTGAASSEAVRASSLVLLIAAHLTPAETVGLLSDFLAMVDDGHAVAMNLCITALVASSRYNSINSVALTNFVHEMRLTAIRKINKLANETKISPLRILGCSQIAISGHMPLNHLLIYSVHAFIIRRLFMFEEYAIALRAAENISTYAQAKSLFQTNNEMSLNMQYSMHSDDNETILYKLHSECTCLLSVLKGIYCSAWTELTKQHKQLSLTTFPMDEKLCREASDDTEQHLLDALEFILNGQLRNHDSVGRYSKQMAQLEAQFTDGIRSNGVTVDRFSSLQRLETAVVNQCCAEYCRLIFVMGSLYSHAGNMDEAHSYYTKLEEFVVWIVKKDDVANMKLSTFLSEPIIIDILGYITKGILCSETMLRDE